MVDILLAGESWISAVVDHKGYDAFPHTQVHLGCEELLRVLELGGHEVTHLHAHDVAEFFPSSMRALEKYDVVLLSDIGSNSLLLPPEVFEYGRPAPNRLKLLNEWTHRGGGLMMAGGYLSFQGFQAKANYAGTPLEEALPVHIARYDDRIETPEGVCGRLADEEHPIIAGLDREWPILLGYQELVARSDATVLAWVDEHPLLVARHVGQGRSLAFASDVSPHWAPKEFMDWEGYSQLFNNSVSWLAGD